MQSVRHMQNLIFDKTGKRIHQLPLLRSDSHSHLHHDIGTEQSYHRRQYPFRNKPFKNS